MEDQHNGTRLSSTQQDLEAFLADGGDFDSLMGSGALVTSAEATLTVPFLHDDGVMEVISLEALLPLENMRLEFASIVALRTQEVELSTLRLELAKLIWFVRFLVEKKLLQISLAEIDNETLQHFRDWLDVQRMKRPGFSGGSYL